MPSGRKKSSGKTTCNRFYNLDMYGRPVSLTFHGEEKFKTPVGVVLTISLVLFLCLFIAYNLAKLNQLTPSLRTELYQDSFY